MIRKDYIALAEALKAKRPPEEKVEAFKSWEDCVFAVADVLSSDNPRFNRARFLAACEWPEW